MQQVAKVLPDIIVYPISERAVTIEFGNSINEVLMHNIKLFADQLQSNPFPGYQITVPAYATLSVFFDPIVVAQSNLNGNGNFEKVGNYVKQQFVKSITIIGLNHPITIIPVCYGGDLGTDLSEVAQINNLSTEEVVKVHTSATYLVHMIGFLPGFAYLGGMSSTIAAPRKSVPRAAIQPGSVGIAGLQTGIYPLQTPGGWQIIGRTPLKLFDINRAEPSLLKAGDRVKFQSVGYDEFMHLQNQINADQNT